MARGDDLAHLLWEHPTPSSRGPRPSLTLPQIAGRAVGIADGEGMAAVSMQRLAEELGVSKMSLYRYVRSKEHLVALAIEQAVGEPGSLAGGDWRVRTVRWSGQIRDVWRAHPWLPGVTIGNRAVGPREVAWTEAAAVALAGSGLAGGALRTTIALLFAHFRTALAPDLAGTQHWDTGQQVGRFPAGTVVESAEDDVDPWRYGIELILDGVAAGHSHVRRGRRR